MITEDPAREAIHNAIEAHAPVAETGGAVLTGWTVVAEWMDADGARWLTRGCAEGMTTWGAKGLHHEAIYGEWPD